MKEIKIQIPEGKKVVLTFVDESDNPPVTERIKTFNNAYNELGDEHPLICQYRDTYLKYSGNRMTNDLIAYLKLRIIVAALNEGWEPKFTEDEYRYFPWFRFYTEEEYNKLDNEEKERCVLRSGNGTHSSFGFVYCGAVFDASYSSTYYGSRLALRTSELAIYAGKQFIKEYLDYICQHLYQELLLEYCQYHSLYILEHEILGGMTVIYLMYLEYFVIWHYIQMTLLKCNMKMVKSHFGILQKMNFQIQLKQDHENIFSIK